MDRWKVLLGGDYLSEDCQWRNKINSDITHREKWYNSPSHRTRTQVTFLFRGILKLWYFSSKLMVELYFIPIYAQHDWLNKFSQAISAVHYGKDENEPTSNKQLWRKKFSMDGKEPNFKQRYLNSPTMEICENIWWWMGKVGGKF